MIIIPVLGRTRSSLVAGIFHACGAWVGDTTVAMPRRYDTFENWDVIMHLQENYGCKGIINPRVARDRAPEFRRFVESVIPHDRVVVLKFIFYYHELFEKAFPDSDFYFLRRDHFSEPEGPKIRIRMERYLDTMRAKKGTWINTDRINNHDFSKIRPIIRQYSALEWNSRGVDALYDTVGDKKFSKMKRMKR